MFKRTTLHHSNNNPHVSATIEIAWIAWLCIIIIIATTISTASSTNDASSSSSPMSLQSNRTSCACVKNKSANEDFFVWHEDSFQFAIPITLVCPTESLDASADVMVVEEVLKEPSTRERSVRPALPPQINQTILFVPNASYASQDASQSFSQKRFIHPIDGSFSCTRVFPELPGYPYNLVGKLFFRRPDLSIATCSASILQRKLILTAGHCVNDGKGNFNTNFIFIPNFVEGRAPFGVWHYSKVWVSDSWANTGAVPNAEDWAIIEIDEQDIGGKVQAIGDYLGWFGYQTNDLENNHVTSLGFPANYEMGLRMYEVTSTFRRKRPPNNAEYPNCMEEGASGGPWISDFGRHPAGVKGMISGDGNAVVGISSYRDKNTSRKYLGSSILNQAFIDLYNQACANQNNCDKTQS